MSIFMVLSQVKNDELRAAVERTFPDRFYHHSDLVSFVRGGGTAQAVAKSLGVKRREGEEIIPGFQSVIVIEASPNYSGWTSSSAWPWLKSGFEIAHDG